MVEMTKLSWYHRITILDSYKLHDVTHDFVITVLQMVSENEMKTRVYCSLGYRLHSYMSHVENCMWAMA